MLWDSDCRLFPVYRLNLPCLKITAGKEIGQLLLRYLDPQCQESKHLHYFMSVFVRSFGQVFVVAILPLRFITRFMFIIIQKLGHSWSFVALICNSKWDFSFETVKQWCLAYYESIVSQPVFALFFFFLQNVYEKVSCPLCKISHFMLSNFVQLFSDRYTYVL